MPQVLLAKHRQSLPNKVPHWHYQYWQWISLWFCRFRHKLDCLNYSHDFGLKNTKFIQQSERISVTICLRMLIGSVKFNFFPIFPRTLTNAHRFQRWWERAGSLFLAKVDTCVYLGPLISSLAINIHAGICSLFDLRFKIFSLLLPQAPLHTNMWLEVWDRFQSSLWDVSKTNSVFN